MNQCNTWLYSKLFTIVQCKDQKFTNKCWWSLVRFITWCSCVWSVSQHIQRITGDKMYLQSSRDISYLYLYKERAKTFFFLCNIQQKEWPVFTKEDTLIFLPDSRSATPYRENLGVIYLFGLLATIQPDKTFWEVMRTNMWHFYTINMLHELMHPWHLND